MTGETASDAVEAGLRMLRHRDVSVHELDARLAERGYDTSDREHAIATLVRGGLLDDRRYAEHRARALAARGAGDRLITHTLETAGIPLEVVHDAVGALEPEDERARIVVERRGPGPRTARYLQAKGYAEDVVVRAVAGGGTDALR